MIEQNMAKLGFSPSEIKVYLHLLNSGSSYANRISSETGINRTNVYEAIERLISKGIVSFITKNKVKWVEAKSPESVLSIIDEKGDELDAMKNNILDDIKKLKTMPQKEFLEAGIFTGKKGLRMIFEDILEDKKPISLIASQLQFKEFFGPYFELWHKQRIEKKIHQRSIFPYKFSGKLEKREFLMYKFVDDKFTSPTTTIIYGENCLFIQWSKEPIAIKVKNEEISKSHLNYFNMLWNS